MDITLLVVSSTATSIDDGQWRVGKKKKMRHGDSTTDRWTQKNGGGWQTQKNRDRNMELLLGASPTTFRGIMDQKCENEKILERLPSFEPIREVSLLRFLM